MDNFTESIDLKKIECESNNRLIKGEFEFVFKIK